MSVQSSHLWSCGPSVLGPFTGRVQTSVVRTFWSWAISGRSTNLSDLVRQLAMPLTRQTDRDQAHRRHETRKGHESRWYADLHSLPDWSLSVCLSVLFVSITW